MEYVVREGWKDNQHLDLLEESANELSKMGIISKDCLEEIKTALDKHRG